MTFFSRAARFQCRKIALVALGIGLAASLIFTAFRTRRLLGEARAIAIQSAAFSRDYYLGNGPNLTYLAMGDSTAAGWGAGDLTSTYPHQIAQSLAARGRRVHVINVAVGGATLGEVRRYQSAYLQSARPDLITVSAGANDATHRTGDADFRRELRLLLADLEKSSARNVLVSNVPDMFLAPALPTPLAMVVGKRAQSLNAVLAQMPQSGKLKIVDLFGQGKLNYQRDAGLYAADLFHPSGRGYAIWAGLFVEKLSALANLDDFA